MEPKEQALTLLNEVCERRVTDIIEKWRSSQTVEERELCATELNATEELKELIEAQIAHEFGRNDK